MKKNNELSLSADNPSLLDKHTLPETKEAIENELMLIDNELGILYVRLGHMRQSRSSKEYRRYESDEIFNKRFEDTEVKIQALLKSESQLREKLNQLMRPQHLYLKKAA